MNKDCSECREIASFMEYDVDGNEVRFCELHYQLEIEGKLDPREFEGRFGMCTKCQKMTPILEPCCYAPVKYNQSLYNIGDFAYE